MSQREPKGYRGGDAYSDVMQDMRGHKVSALENGLSWQADENDISSGHDPLDTFVPIDEVLDDADNPEEALLRAEEVQRVEDDESHMGPVMGWGDLPAQEEEKAQTRERDRAAALKNGIPETQGHVADRFTDESVYAHVSDEYAGMTWTTKQLSVNRIHKPGFIGHRAYLKADDRICDETKNAKNHISKASRQARHKRDMPEESSGVVARTDRVSLPEIKLEYNGRYDKEDVSAVTRFAIEGFAGLSASDVWQRHSKGDHEEKKAFGTLEKKIASLATRGDMLDLRGADGERTVEDCIKQLVLETNALCQEYPALQKNGTDPQAPGMEFLYNMLHVYDMAYSFRAEDIASMPVSSLRGILVDALGKAISWSVSEPSARVPNDMRTAYEKYIRKAYAVLDKLPYISPEAYVA
jgi:hypothetical protein